MLPTNQPPESLPDLAAGDRTLTSTQGRTEFFVTNTNDSGASSLRQAILDPNADPGAETIRFTGSVFTNSPRPSFALDPDVITLTSGQLEITDAVTREYRG